MEKVIQVNEAARRLGVTHQTVKNWAASGLINVTRIGRAYYVKEREIDALFEDAHDVEETVRRIKRLKESYLEEERQMFKQRNDDAWQRRYLNISVRSSIRTQFFQTVVEMLKNIGSISERSADILTRMLDGEPLDDICKRHQLQGERIRQIARDAMRKSLELAEWKEKVERVSVLESDNKVLLGELADLKKKMDASKTTKEAEWTRSMEESDEICTLMKTPLSTTNLSTRAINALLGYFEWTPNGRSTCR